MTEELLETSNENQFQELSVFPNSGFSDAEPLTFQSWNPFTGTGFHDPVMLRYNEMRADLEERIRDIEQREQMLLEREQKLLDEQNTVEQELIRKTAEIDAAYESRIQLLTTTLEKMESEYKLLWHGQSRAIVEFSVSLVERLVEKSVVNNSEFLVRQIEAAVDEAYEEEFVTIHISPEDLEMLDNGRSDAFRKLTENRKLKWSAKTDLQQGQLFVDAKQYRLDASLATLLKNIRDDIFSANLNQEFSTLDVKQKDDDANQ